MRSGIDLQGLGCEGDVRRCCLSGAVRLPRGTKSGRGEGYPERCRPRHSRPNPSGCRPGCHAIPHFSKSQSKPWFGLGRDTRSREWPRQPARSGWGPGKLCEFGCNERPDWGPPSRLRWFVLSRGRSRPHRCCRPSGTPRKGPTSPRFLGGTGMAERPRGGQKSSRQVFGGQGAKLSCILCPQRWSSLFFEGFRIFK